VTDHGAQKLCHIAEISSSTPVPSLRKSRAEQDCSRPLCHPLPSSAVVLDRHGWAMRPGTQFSLRQMFLGTTLVAACLGTAKWCCIRYVDPIVPVTLEGGLDRCTGVRLDSYLGKRVSLSGRLQSAENPASCQVVWLGSQPLAIVGAGAKNLSLLPIVDGAMVTVTGRLDRLPPNVTLLVTIERPTWQHERPVPYGTRVQRVVIYIPSMWKKHLWNVQSESVKVELRGRGERKVDSCRVFGNVVRLEKPV
jgi:hypothetical protein